MSITRLYYHDRRSANVRDLPKVGPTVYWLVYLTRLPHRGQLLSHNSISCFMRILGSNQVLVLPAYIKLCGFISRVITDIYLVNASSQLCNQA